MSDHEVLPRPPLRTGSYSPKPGNCGLDCRRPDTFLRPGSTSFSAKNTRQPEDLAPDERRRDLSWVYCSANTHTRETWRNRRSRCNRCSIASPDIVSQVVQVPPKTRPQQPLPA